ncbi:hypothetical protein PHMEG_00034355, partial [Phytophthora megakarya]
MLSPRDCVALIQTLLVEAGFSFRNVVPDWFRSPSSQIAPSAVRIAVEGIQHLLATELIEWRQVAYGVKFQVVDVQDGPLVIQDYHAEDVDGDLLMTDHESGLLATTTCAAPSGGSIHAVVELAAIVSLIGYEQPERGHPDETMSSIQNVSSRSESDFVPSLFSTSGWSIESTRSGTSGSKLSQDESSSSSVWPLGQPAAGHMPFRAYAPMVMTAQGGAVQANTHMGMQVVQTILPPPPVMAEPDDVVMSESGEVSIQSERNQSLTTQRCQESSVIQEDVKPSNAFSAFQSIGSIRHKRQADDAILAAHAEAAVQAERLRAAKDAKDRLKAQQFQTEADYVDRLRVQRMQDASELARGVDNVQKNTTIQIAIFQQEMREMEAKHDREREAAKNIQKFQASQLRDLRATSAHVQHAIVTPVPDAVSQIKTESGIANFQQDARSHDAGNVAVKREKSADKEATATRADALLAVQLQATIQSMNAAKQRTKPATTVPTAVKTEAGARATKAPAPKSSDDAKAKAKKATPKARASRK